MRVIRDATGAQRAIGYVIRLEATQATVELTMTEAHLNRIDQLHGGIMAVLLDSVCGYAASMEADGQLAPVTTLSMTVNYLRAMPMGVVRGHGRVTGGGKSIKYCEGVLHDAEGRAIASATAIFKRLNGFKGETK